MQRATLGICTNYLINLKSGDKMESSQAKMEGRGMTHGGGWTDRDAQTGGINPIKL